MTFLVYLLDQKPWEGSGGGVILSVEWVTKSAQNRRNSSPCTVSTDILEKWLAVGCC